jgi:hypothetical protein
MRRSNVYQNKLHDIHTALNGVYHKTIESRLKLAIHLHSQAYYSIFFRCVIQKMLNLILSSVSPIPNNEVPLDHGCDQACVQL